MNGNKLDPDIRSSTSYNLFRDTLSKFIKHAQRKNFNINDSFAIKLLPRLRLGFSHLCKWKHRHGYRNMLNPRCPCSVEAKTITHCFLPFHFYNANRMTLINDLNEVADWDSVAML